MNVSGQTDAPRLHIARRLQVAIHCRAGTARNRQAACTGDEFVHRKRSRNVYSLRIDLNGRRFNGNNRRLCRLFG